MAAFWKLATAWRVEVNLPTLAVTGSVGKTTTKEMLASILVQVGSGNYSQKSYNNHVGVPYTLLKASPQHRWQVIEIGMNHPGEIQALSNITKPDICMVTEVAAAHIGAFENIEGIGKEKLSIVAGATDGSILIVNGDNETIKKVIQQQGLDRKYSIRSVGQHPENDYVLSEIKAEALDHLCFTVTGNTKNALEGYTVTTALHVPGAHNVRNAALAAVAAKYLLPTITTEQIAKGIDRFLAPLMRSNIKELSKDRMMLDDSYNANPASMKAMLEIAAQTKHAGKKIGFVLGDMRELGSFSAKYHQELAHQILSIQPAFVFFVGDECQQYCLPLFSGSGVQAQVFATPEEAGKAATTQTFDMIFIKASRGIGLDRAAKIIESIS